jgi:hypothetical protein
LTSPSCDHQQRHVIDLAVEPACSFNVFIFNVFFKGDNVHGTVLWNSKHDTKSAYKLEIDKVVICSTINGYMPIYDPDGTVYRQGAKLGCLESHKFVNQRHVLLDRYNPVTIVNTLHKIPFNAEFSTTISNLTNTTLISDSFKFSVDPLFDRNERNATSGSGNDVPNWYIQVFYYIRPASSKFNRRSNTDRQRLSSLYQLNNIYNNGTNIQSLKIGNKDHKIVKNNKFKFMQPADVGGAIKHTNQNNVLLKVLIPLLVLLSLTSLTLVAIIYYRRQKVNESDDQKVPPFPKVNTYDGDDDDVAAVLSLSNVLKSDYLPKTGAMRTKVTRADPFNTEYSNCTLQTATSSAASSTNSHENCYNLSNNAKDIRRKLDVFNTYSIEKLRSFVKRIYTPVPTDDLNQTQISQMANSDTKPSKSKSLKKSKHKKSNNYLYFNYANNSDASSNSTEFVKTRQSSVKSLLSSFNPNKNKRLSGTEV